VKKCLKFLFFVTILLCTIPCSAFAADDPSLDVSYNINGTVKVEFSKDSTDSVLVAFYDTSGRMLRCTAVTDESSISLPTEAVCVKAFLLSETSVPCLPAAELSIPASFCNVTTAAELQQAMDSTTFRGAILVNDLTLSEITIPAGKTLITPSETTLTVSDTLDVYGTLNVYGTLTNSGTIHNNGFIDVLGGTLNNYGTIEGSWNAEGEYYESGLGIEGGAVVNNEGNISDGVSVADFYREDGESLCEYSDLDLTEGYLAVAFGADQIQTCLASERNYDVVMACGDDPENVNTVELGGITVPEGTTLLLKESVFDGEDTYRSSYQIGTDIVSTLNENAKLFRLEGTARTMSDAFNVNGTLIVSGTLNVYGTLTNSGTIHNNGFIDVLGGTLNNFGTIEGIWNAEGEYFESGLGIEGGAVVNNEGVISDGVSVADYYREGGKSICEYSNLDLTDGYIAVAFGADQIQPCLDSERGYDIVMACGDDPENVNTVELGDITVPEGKTLMLKESIFDGADTYHNSYEISGDTTMTLEEAAELLCMDGTALTVSGTLNVYGTLTNIATIYNNGFIDVLGGTLNNFGTIEGIWNAEGEYFESGLGIEGGAVVNNEGDISDGVSVADYYREDGESICEYSNLELTDGYFAVAFGADRIQPCLDSDRGYDIVMVCGDDPENVNTVELGGITVPEGKTLLLKESIFDGADTYLNSYEISSDTTLTLEENAELLCLEGTALTVSGTLNVYGTLTNSGTIHNNGFIDVLGGTLNNYGTIEGSWNAEGEYYESGLGIEGGAVVNNEGTIWDGVSVADYYWSDGESICEYSNLELTDGYIAVAFGAAQIQPCLDSERGYDIVMACGDDPENVNIVELGGITVPEGKTLLLKESIFDGADTYRNSYEISGDTTLTLTLDSALICVGQSNLAAYGSIDDQGAYIEFGNFTYTTQNP